MLLLNILLALAWTGLSGTLTYFNFLEGFLLGYIVLWLATRRGFEGERDYFLRQIRILSFVGFFLKELVVANWNGVKLMLSPRPNLRPAIVRIPLDVKSDIQITLLAHLITLTPGTLSLDVTEDKSALFVHTVYLDDVESFRRSIKNGFERRVLEVFR